MRLQLSAVMMERRNMFAVAAAGNGWLLRGALLLFTVPDARCALFKSTFAFVTDNYIAFNQAVNDCSLVRV